MNNINYLYKTGARCSKCTYRRYPGGGRLGVTLYVTMELDVMTDQGSDGSLL